MEVVAAVANSLAVLVAIIAAIIALTQLRLTRIDSRAARNAQLAWSVYEAYESIDLKKGREALDIVSRIAPVPTSGAEFQAMYRDSTYSGPAAEEVRKVQDRTDSYLLRSILRYYQQVGILYEKGLIDGDFLFPLIGPGLRTARPAIAATVDYYQRFYKGSPSENNEGPRRGIYKNALKLVSDYECWEKNR